MELYQALGEEGRAAVDDADEGKLQGQGIERVVVGDALTDRGTLLLRDEAFLDGLRDVLRFVNHLRVAPADGDVDDDHAENDAGEDACSRHGVRHGGAVRPAGLCQRFAGGVCRPVSAVEAEHRGQAEAEGKIIVERHQEHRDAQAQENLRLVHQAAYRHGGEGRAAEALAGRGLSEEREPQDDVDQLACPAAHGLCDREADRRDFAEDLRPQEQPYESGKERGRDVEVLECFDLFAQRDADQQKYTQECKVCQNCFHVFPPFL